MRHLIENLEKSNILKANNIGADYVPGADWSSKHRNPGFIHIRSACKHEPFVLIAYDYFQSFYKTIFSKTFVLSTQAMF